jgi:23S rRNA (guanosine2251-2'-O)-methyltransferase
MIEETTYVYGKHAVKEVLTVRPALVRTVHLAPDFTDEGILDLIKQAKIARASFDPKKLPKGISPDAVHQGIIAQVEIGKLLVPYDSFVKSLKVTSDTGLIVLGEVQDPQNVGSIIRSAAAFGIAGILIPEHRQAPLSGAVIKVSAGMAFRVPLVQIGNVNHTLEDLKLKGFWTYGLEQSASQPVSREGFEKPSVFIVGNEADGIRAKTLEHCDIPLMIPMHARAESLNAAVATAVVLSHWSQKHPGALQ